MHCGRPDHVKACEGPEEEAGYSPNVPANGMNTISGHEQCGNERGNILEDDALPQAFTRRAGGFEHTQLSISYSSKWYPDVPLQTLVISQSPSGNAAIAATDPYNIVITHVPPVGIRDAAIVLFLRFKLGEAMLEARRSSNSRFLVELEANSEGGRSMTVQELWLCCVKVLAPMTTGGKLGRGRSMTVQESWLCCLKSTRTYDLSLSFGAKELSVFFNMG